MLSANPQNVALKFDCFMSTVDFDKKNKSDRFFETFVKYCCDLF